MLLNKVSLTSIFVALATILNAVQAHYPISGVQSGIDRQTGYRPPRRDILDLQNDLPQFSLYIQALTKLMQVNESTLTSYFQIGGIHGRPFIAWDGVNPATPGAGDSATGYCTHGNTLFPTWHRPYLALFEQVLVGFAQDIAKSYHSQEYENAANLLRIPYWDWAAIPQLFPDVMTWESIQINTPTGIKNITNPLYSYKFLNHPEPLEWFPTSEGGFDAFLAEQPETVRYANSNNQSQDADINPNFVEEGPALTSAVWHTFASTLDYNTMSTQAISGYDFESPHGSVHVYVGGTGHMTEVPWAGFDPAFWLHHANVDRLIAMWQAIYPDAWLQPSTSGSDTWTIVTGQQIDDSTPLTPFTTSDGKTPYTSVSARYTKYFGYSYPDVEDWIGTPDELSANVTARVNQLYNPNGALTPKRSMRIRDKSIVARSTTRAWSVALNVPIGAVGEPFSVQVAVGDVSVGRLTILSAPSQAQIDAGTKRFGTLTLTNGLAGVDTEDVDAVVAYLKGSLKWNVVKTSDGSIVPNDQVNGLNVVVQDQIVTPAPDITKFPTFGNATLHPEVTA